MSALRHKLKFALSRNDSGNWTEKFDDKGIIVLRSTEQTAGGGWQIVDPARLAFDHPLPEDAFLKSGDIVITKSSGSSLHIGKSSLVDEPIEAMRCTFSNFMQRLRCKPDYWPSFVWYFLNSNEGRSQLDSSSSSSTGLANLNGTLIGNLEVIFPSPTEQRRIAVYLDEQTGKLDRLMDMRRRQMALLNEQRAALIQEAVTRGLNPNAPMKESGLPWLGEIPAHWELKEIRYLVPQNRQVMYGIVLPGPNVDVGVPIVKAGNCEPGRLSIDTLHRTTFEIEAGYVRSRLRTGDIVYAIRGSFGEAEIVTSELEGANLTQDAARIAPKPGVHNRWLWYAVRSRAFFAQMDSVAVGATIRGVNIRDLKRGRLAVPPAPEQKQIADFIDSENTKFDTLYFAYGRQLTVLGEYRASLIHECVTGQRRIGEDPAPETL